MSLFGTDEMALKSQIARDLDVSPVNVCTVGSLLICGEGNDVDLLCLVPSEDCLEKAGFIQDTDELLYEGTSFRSWRRGEVNVIATTDRGFFLSEIAIAYAAKAVLDDNWDMRSRNDRVQFHGEVRAAVSVRLTAHPVHTSDLIDLI